MSDLSKAFLVAVLIVGPVAFAIFAMVQFEGAGKPGQTATSSRSNGDQFYAYVTCRFRNEPIGVEACFLQSEIKIVSNGTARVYRVHELGALRWRAGLRFALTSSFYVEAQNSSENGILQLEIFDTNGNRRFQDQVSQWQTIRVRN